MSERKREKCRERGRERGSEGRGKKRERESNSRTHFSVSAPRGDNMILTGLCKRAACMFLCEQTTAVLAVI